MRKTVLITLAVMTVLTGCQKSDDDDIIRGIDLSKKVSYTITSESDIANLYEYCLEIPIFDNLPAAIKTLVPTVLNSYFNQTSPAHIYRYEYESTGPDGKPVTLSSALIVPLDAITGDNPVDQLVLGNHFSSMRYDECPTMSGCIEGLLAWKNAAVVMPDYYGFGASQNKVQAYLNPDAAGCGSLDAFLAAETLMKDKRIDVPEKTMNMGYSQGGFNAIANLRYLSLHPEYDIHFDQTFAGGGPYNVINTFNSYLEGGFDSVFPLILVTLTSLNEIENLGIDYADIFKEPLLSNYQDWVLSKKYDSSEVADLLGSTRPSDHLTENMTSCSGPIFEKYLAVADKYSLNKGWTPDRNEKITLFHSKGDDMVPYSNFESMVQFLDGKCQLQSITQQSGSHQLTYVAFLLHVIQYGM